MSDATGEDQLHSPGEHVEVNGHGNHHASEADAVQLALALIQGKWKIRILSHLQHGPARLSQLRKSFPEASKKMLVQHLREMEKDGLIARTDMSDKLRHVEYSLKDPLGITTACLLSTLAQWAANYKPPKSRQNDIPRLFDA